MNSCFTKQYGKTLINSLHGNDLQKTDVLNGMSKYIILIGRLLANGFNCEYFLLP